MTRDKGKEILFDLFDEYSEYHDIIQSLRSLVSEKKLTNIMYDIIMTNYDEWLKEYEKEVNKG